MKNNMRFKNIKLKEFRKKFGFSLNDVSKKTNIDISLLKDIEKGKRDITLSQLAKLAQLYNKFLTDFFD